jgi:hypothetical protein
MDGARLADFQNLDQGAGGTANLEHQVDFNTEEKLAEVLASLGAADEFAAFSDLLRTRPALYRRIPAYRLYPEHLMELPDSMMAESLQMLEMDEIRAILNCVQDPVRSRLASMLTEKQRAIASHGEEGERSPETLRAFLQSIHGKYFLNDVHAAEQVFGTADGGGGNFTAA